ncbi:MAG TPA: HEAT repeat domain-containing protein [Lysobacter sp.]|jgi:hypothetical protein|nr:HEAT repeat domain-containing protein [Lysobacter sp.]
MRLRNVHTAVCLSALLWLTACAPSSYAVRNPEPSGVHYAVIEQPAADLALVDSRAASERVFHSGTLSAALTIDKAPIDPTSFLAKNLEAELASRGIAAKVGTHAETFPRIDLKGFRIQNHRTNGYTPYITFTFISADIETAAGKKRVGVFVKRGKVPVWSFEEVVEPTFNQPLSLAVKELAAKISAHLYGARADDATVDELAAKLKTRHDNSFLDVYALGFTNNPRAIDTIAALTGDEDEYVRIAAISSLGNLHATGKLEQLKAIYHDAKLWQDRAMAIKAIGDLDTPEAKAYLAEQAAHWNAQSPDKESMWTSQVIGLYL